MVIVEKSFPRGGEPAPKEPVTENTEQQFFGAVQRKIKKPKSKSLKKALSAADGQEGNLEAFSAEPLNYDTIQDGMIIMGLVKKVDQLYLNVSLPGRMVARVTALEISDSYIKATKEFLQNTSQTENYKSLKELYHERQIVYGRVMEVKKNAKGHVNIDMTLRPSEVHSELIHSSIRKGFVFNGAVEEVQEHGYIIESGIKGLRCFVPLDKSQAGHAVGEMVFLKVEKITADKSVSTCICKEVAANKLKVKDQTEPKLDYLMPSCIVNFQVSKRLKDGLKGSIMNETFTAYVNEHHLGHPLFTTDAFELNTNYEARILYVMPLTKLVYLTMNIKKNKQEADADDDDEEQAGAVTLQHGDVVEKAKVHHLGTGGIVLILNKKLKGILSFKTIKANYKGNYDQDELLTKYAKGSKHKVRILEYDVMDDLYICTDDAAKVNEKFFALEDLQPGEFVTATVKAQDSKIQGYQLQVGKLKAVIEHLFLAPVKNLEENAKLKCRVVAVNHERKIAYLTNRSEYMAKNCNILTSLEEAKINGNYMGTVVKCGSAFIVVKFFGDLKGMYYRRSGQNQHFTEGQTMQFRVAEKKDGQLVLGLVENIFKLGEICPVTVVNKLESGIEIKINVDSSEDAENTEHKGLVPVHLLSQHLDLLRGKLRSLQPGDETKATCVAGSIFSLRDIQYFTEHVTPTWKSVKIGDILKCYVKDVENDVVDLMVPIIGYNRPVKVHMKMMLMDEKSTLNVTLTKDQVLYAKVLGKTDLTKTITLSAKLTDVWDCQLASTAGYVESYLNEVADIKKSLKLHGDPIADLNIGEKVTAIFQCVNSVTNDWEYLLEKSQVTGIVKSWVNENQSPPKPGSKQECVIIWLDYSNNLAVISNKKGDMEHICSNESASVTNWGGKSAINAKVLYKNESVFICSLKKGVNPLAICPIQLHFNDFEKTASVRISEGHFCRLTFVHNTLPIAVLEDTHKVWKEYNRKRKLLDDNQPEVKAKKSKLEEKASAKDNKKLKPEAEDNKETKAEKKRKTEAEDNKKTKAEKKRKTSEAQEEEDETPKAKTAKTNGLTKEKDSTKVKAKQTSLPANDATKEEEPSILFYEDKTPDKKSAAKIISIDSITKAKDTKVEGKSQTPKALAGISDFWTSDLTALTKKDESSDEDADSDEEQNAEAKPKKKLTAAEKFKQQREEEARLRAIEEKYADPNQLPDSVDQFDRLVLSDPNNSKHWINYMAFHLQSAEIDKARAVARRALKTISFRDGEDQINIWVALMNLELNYGGKESFNEILKEAIMYNEPLKIYLRAVDVLRNAQKNQELIEMIGVITKKFKTEQEMWKVAANAFFEIGMVERAQQLLQKAMTCLPERDHVNTIVMFANLNNKHGHAEMAQTLLDQVVTSYPKRVDIWAQYVDMLVKDDLIDSARNILERAVVQKIPLRKMRTIFKKYLEFEERFGNDANVQRVKQLAMDYVKKSENL